MAKKKKGVHKNKRGLSSPTDVTALPIDLTGEPLSNEDEDSHANTARRSNRLSGLRKRIKTEHDDGSGTENLKTTGLEGDEEIQFVEAPAAAAMLVTPTPPAAAAAAAAAAASAFASARSNSTTTDDDIQVVGMVNEQRLPHARQHCNLHRFQDNTAGSSILQREQANMAHCDKCYCYVCDCPVKDCKDWKRHCHATDTGTTASYWRNQRALKKQQSAHQPAAPAAPAAQQQQQQSDDPNVAHCRHCQAPMRLRDKWGYNIWHGSESMPTSSDWCNKCGRVARACDLGKGITTAPLHVHDPKIMISLGTKRMEFTLEVRDPRRQRAFEDKWVQREGEPGWIYDEKDMHEEMFQHRVGSRPSVSRVVELLKNGTGSSFDEETGRPIGYSSWGCEHLLIPEWNDRLVLQSLNRTNSYSVIHNLSAVWDKEQMKGTFELDVYIRCPNERTSEIAELGALLGAWFRLFPLKLADISGLLEARKPPKPPSYYPWENDSDDGEEESPIGIEVARLKAALKARTETHSIQRSNQSLSRPGMGGTSPNVVNTNWPAVMCRYYEEMLPVFGAYRIDGGYHYSQATLKQVDEKGLVANSGSRDGQLDAFLTYREEVICKNTLDKSAERLFEEFTTPKNLVLQLENLGHEAAPYIEGLNVELLPFQKQTLQWAAEREMVTGGVNSFTWTKLPSLAATATATANNNDAQTMPADLYFNPALQKLSREQPPLVRGGIIAEEQGLGKTVISLALILRNPAPDQPESGSKSSCLAALPAVGPSSIVFWDPNLSARAQAENSKRGSILSRGTLVVCTVSLVGQWVEEAKSKLKDPGLVYSYHGHNRKRDPNVLARNSIVVTTYETLASDATFHRKKSKNPDKYCPPCEQVRWWCIICDESHVLRHSSSKVNTLLDLVGDCRWLVTGTPVNTGLNDLKNQLRFLGLDDVGSFCRNVNLSASSRRHRGRISKHDEMVRYRRILYLLRPILMRHSQDQRYSGTTTTLMSLPPKTERVAEVSLLRGDAAEYKKMEKAARSAYASFKARTRKIGTRFLKLSQLLLPLRVACAGGNAPLAEDCGYIVSDEEDEENGGKERGEEDEEDDDEDEGQHKRKKRVVRYSKYTFTSKMLTLIEELKRVREEDDTSKSLVFSQFPSTLKWLQGELPMHGFQFRTLSGDMPMRKRAKALHDFQNDPPTTIFLLSMRAGAVGINLTQANRVFLLEPHFNPALEAQAIGRVHRLGQTRRVEIIRMVVKDSVESRMVQMLENKYGKATEDEDDDVVDDDEKEDVDDDEKMHDDEEEVIQKHCTKSRGADMVGSLKSEKVDVVEEEFDLLFGLEK